MVKAGGGGGDDLEIRQAGELVRANRHLRWDEHGHDSTSPGEVSRVNEVEPWQAGQGGRDRLERRERINEDDLSRPARACARPGAGMDRLSPPSASTPARTASVPSSTASSIVRGPRTSPARIAPGWLSSSDQSSSAGTRPWASTSVAIAGSACGRSENTWVSTSSRDWSESDMWCRIVTPSSSSRARYRLRWYWCSVSPGIGAAHASMTSTPASASRSAASRPSHPPPQSAISAGPRTVRVLDRLPRLAHEEGWVLR